MTDGSARSASLSGAPTERSLDEISGFPYDAIHGEAGKEAAPARRATVGDRPDTGDRSGAGALADGGGREGHDPRRADPPPDESVGRAGDFTEGQRAFLRWLVAEVIRKRDEAADVEGREVA